MKMLRLWTWCLLLSLVSIPPAFGLCSYWLFEIQPGQVVPPSNSAGSGYGSLFVCDHDQMTGYVSVVLDEHVTAVHLHGPAGPREIGPVLYDLGVLSNGVTDVDIVVPAELEDLFAARQAYVDVHTSEHPDGAIRGLVHPEGLPVSRSTWGGIKLLYRE